MISRAVKSRRRTLDTTVGEKLSPLSRPTLSEKKALMAAVLNGANIIQETRLQEKGVIYAGGTLVITMEARHS